MKDRTELRENLTRDLNQIFEKIASGSPFTEDNKTSVLVFLSDFLSLVEEEAKELKENLDNPALSKEILLTRSEQVSHGFETFLMGTLQFIESNLFSKKEYMDLFERRTEVLARNIMLPIVKWELSKRLGTSIQHVDQLVGETLLELEKLKKT